MIYNKFKQGFFRNFLAYVLIMVFLAITVLLAVFDHDPNRITISIIGFCLLMLFFVYDLFFSDNPQSELMIAKKLHISQQAISKRKKAIFSKLKKYF